MSEDTYLIWAGGPGAGKIMSSNPPFSFGTWKAKTHGLGTQIDFYFLFLFLLNFFFIFLVFSLLIVESGFDKSYQALSNGPWFCTTL